jgi:hypothetical protein
MTIWLVSYPRSGNTWFRAFVSNLLAGADRPVSIRRLAGTGAASRHAIDETLGFASGDLPGEAGQRLRPAVYRAWAEAGDERDGPLLVKVHDAYARDGGEPLIPAGTGTTIYLVRNPLDVCVSYAHLMGHGDMGRAVSSLCDEAHSLAGRRDDRRRQLHQHLGAWSAHVRGWTGAGDRVVHVVRYEDLLARPVETFGAAAAAAGLTAEPGTVEAAVRSSSFARLQAQEDAVGFRRSPSADARFFRRGAAGSWRDELTADQVDRLIGCHGPTMARFGYLDEHGCPAW